MRFRPSGPLFGLTLRGLFVIITLAAVGLAFVGIKVKRARDEKAVVAELQQTGASIEYAIHGIEGSPSRDNRTWFEQWLDLDLEWHVVKVALMQSKISDRTLELASQLPHLESIVFWGQPRFTVGQLTALGRLRTQNPQQLMIADSQDVTDALVAAAANIPHLESLSLRKDKPASSHAKPTDWTTASLIPLSRAAELRELDFHGQGFTDEHLQNLAPLPALTSLLISDTSITDAGLRAVFQAAPCLEKLVVDQSPIVGSAFSDPKQYPRLYELSIGKCPLTDDDFATIREAQQLRRLQLWECHSLTDKALEHVGALTNLQSLRAIGGQFTDSGVRHLANLQSLTSLTLSSKTGAFSDASAFAVFDSLRYLETGGPLPRVEFDKLRRARPNLKISPPPSP